MKNFSNRFLSSALALVMICISVPFETGCSSSQALADVERFEPVVVNALVLACTITANPLCGVGQAKITADYNTVIQLWTDWNAAVAAGTSTSKGWNDLNAAFTVFEQDSSEIFSLGLGLNAPEVTAIVASAQVLLAAIEALFPSSPAGVQSSKLFAKYGAAKTYDGSWLKAWSRDYNEKVDVAKKLHKSAKLRKVPTHSAFVKYATGGLVK